MKRFLFLLLLAIFSLPADAQSCEPGTYYASGSGEDYCAQCSPGSYCPGNSDKVGCVCDDDCPNFGMTHPNACIRGELYCDDQRDYVFNPANNECLVSAYPPPGWLFGNNEMWTLCPSGSYCVGNFPYPCVSNCVGRTTCPQGSGSDSCGGLTVASIIGITVAIVVVVVQAIAIGLYVLHKKRKAASGVSVPLASMGQEDDDRVSLHSSVSQAYSVHYSQGGGGGGGYQPPTDHMSAYPAHSIKPYPSHPYQEPPQPQQQQQQQQQPTPSTPSSAASFFNSRVGLSSAPKRIFAIFNGQQILCDVPSSWLLLEQVVRQSFGFPPSTALEFRFQDSDAEVFDVAQLSNNDRVVVVAL